MKAICPKNPDHKTFITVAHVSEDWKVDEHGEFLEKVGDVQVDAGPDTDNNWSCATCGAEAEVA